MNITEVRNLVFVEAGAINCEVLIGDEWLPFTASPNDSMDYGVKLYEDALSGVWGDIAPYAQPVQTAEGEASIAATKLALMVNAEAMIAPLARAVKYGIATDEEVASLEAWELYTVKLNRVTPEKPEWPQQP